MSVLRSLLFVPGSRPDRFAKAMASGADCVCIDLEDAVLPQDKETARKAVADFISSGHQQLCVRINSLQTEAGIQDLAAIGALAPAFIMLAKCESVEEVNMAASGCPDSATKIIGLIETIQGLNQAADIAQASDRMFALMFGGGDMSAELRCDFSYEPLLFARSKLVVAAAAANIDLIDVPFIDIQDDQGLHVETTKIQTLGYTAKAAIHPRQVKIIHAAFTPTTEQIAYAEAVINAANGPDSGAIVVNGRMVDRPIVIACQRTLALAKIAQQSH